MTDEDAEKFIDAMSKTLMAARTIAGEAGVCGKCFCNALSERFAEIAESYECGERVAANPAIDAVEILALAKPAGNA